MAPPEPRRQCLLVQECPIVPDEYTVAVEPDQPRGLDRFLYEYIDINEHRGVCVCV